MATEDPAIRIHHEFVAELDTIPELGHREGRRVLEGELRRYFDTTVTVQATAGRLYLAELVDYCSHRPDGLNSLVEALHFLRLVAPESSELWSLCEEWNVIRTFREPNWRELRVAVKALDHMPPAKEPSGIWLRRLASEVTGGRVAELPRHCRTPWHVFVHLFGQNAAADGIPPYMKFLRRFAAQADDDRLTAAVREWNDHWAAKFELTDVLAAAPVRDTRIPDEDFAYLVIQIEIDLGDPEMLLVSHWRQWDSRNWLPGEDLRVSPERLEETVDKLISDMESLLGASPDADRTGAIWLEFVLPFDLFHLPVELWSKSPLPGLRIPIALDHPIVIRSLERLRGRHLHHAWRRRWRAMLNEGGRSYWSRPTGDDYFRRLVAALADERVVSLVLSEPPGPHSQTAYAEIGAALHAGLPAVLWHRQDCAVQGFREDVAALVGDGRFLELPRRIADLRRRAIAGQETGSSLAMHVAIIWDDPGRFPGGPEGFG